MAKNSLCQSWSSVLVVMACAAQLISCQPGRNYYVIEELRVPALQVLQQQDLQTEENLCLELNGENACQQYPLRFAKKVFFRFLAIAPAETEPVRIKFTRLQRAKLAQPLSLDAGCFEVFNAAKTQTFEDVPLSQLGLSEDAATGSIQQESPLRVEEHLASFTAPEKSSIEADLSTLGYLPLFQLDYEATSGSLRADRGYFTFAFSTELASSASDNERCLARLLTGNTSDVTNKAPQISAISPAQGAVVAGSPQTLQLEFKREDKDKDAKQRIQWYISRGELDNKGAASTQLTFSGSEPLTAVGIVRDLQGGVDFAWSTFSVTP